jgi:murein DD-endopeptidase MepM/ murein hydrolase activator NlpD
MASVGRLTVRWLATRRDMVRLNTGKRAISTRAQVAIGAVIFALSAWVTVTSLSYIGSRQLLNDTAAQIRKLEQAFADLRSESQLSTKSFMAQINQLEAARRSQENAIRELNEIRATVQRELDSRERQLTTLTQERDHARGQLADLEQSLAGTQGHLESVLADRSALQQRLRQLRTRRESTQVLLKDWVLGSSDALEQLIAETGVDVNTMIARVDAAAGGEGGPLQVAAPGPDASAVKLANLPPSDPVQDGIQRLAALRKLARTLPLASPLDHFFLTSGFGKRRDPFTNQWAFHAGLDFGAAPRSKVLATAPGVVTHAGPAGPYGTMVEIDHGMGIVTRYGHLRSVSVKVGEQVRFREPIGVIGNTGRSTARHLHYEIRIDDVAYDPARFLNAGRFLVGVFANAGGSPVEEVSDTPSND